MADVEFDGFETGGALRRGSRVVSVAGAMTSVALVLGLGYWGYKLAVRDVHGIPVVRALEGPMRIAPEDPGGVITAHQGLSVNSVAEIGVASPPADRLVLAPAPTALSPEDEAGTLAAQEAPTSTRTAAMPGLDLSPGPVPALSDSEEPEIALVISEEPAPMVQDDAVMTALAEALGLEAVPLSADLGDDPAPATLEAPSATLPRGALAASPRPMPRPGSAIAVARPAVADGATDAAVLLASAPATQEVDGSTLATGTRLVQLGAYETVEDARRDWDRLGGRFGDLMIGKSRIVQSAQSGGRTFYRLRATGFEDEADQRRFCSALLSENAACIPVTVR
ncbi:SPOR domain-containing protein [Szabonella alba]|uniref:SPOR domain-containing protein n=1 Tax=Szabonella alba TaxID=2804194 RepID=A0A8K0Y045_9RHOB|nr:SPOR domain-containing protein [Szabonella alba]MBL4917805.1 SPOR domain-containing protein [Szabonella alba]